MRVFPSAQSPEAADPDPEPGHCPRRHVGPAILLAAGAASLASVIVVGVLVVFQDAFRIGATASGLNPGGGGPGFMLMAPPALAALMVARWCEARRVLREFIIVLAVAVPGVLVLPSLLLVLAGAVLPPEFPSLASIVSASAMAWVVPIAVMAILARA
jgi:hypothetical protein